MDFLHDFDRGEVIGGRKPDYASAEFWGGEKDKKSRNGRN